MHWCSLKDRVGEEALPKRPAVLSCARSQWTQSKASIPYSNADLSSLVNNEEKPLQTESFLPAGDHRQRLQHGDRMLASTELNNLHQAVVRDVHAVVAKLLREGLAESNSVLCSNIQGMLQPQSAHLAAAKRAKVMCSSGDSPRNSTLEVRFMAENETASGEIPTAMEPGFADALPCSAPATWVTASGTLRKFTSDDTLPKGDRFRRLAPPDADCEHQDLDLLSAVGLEAPGSRTATKAAPSTEAREDTRAAPFTRISYYSQEGADAALERRLETYQRRTERVVPDAGRKHGTFWVSGKPGRDTAAHRRHKVDTIWDFNISKKAREELDVTTYDVTNFYKETGWAQCVARSELFNSMVLSVVLVNAIYIGVEAQVNKETNPTSVEMGWQISEHCFCGFFVIEWLVRFCAFREKSNCFKDTWFRLDSALALVSVLEIWVTPLLFMLFNDGTDTPTGSESLRLVRLLRLARSVRLFHFLPELLTMVKGMQIAGRAVASSLILLLLLVYTFSVMLFLGFGEQDLTSEFLGSLPKCMQTLFIRGVLMDEIAELSEALLRLGPLEATLSFSLFLIFTLISSMTVMNMLIGILVEVVSAVATGEKEEATIRMMKKSLLVLLVRLDHDGNGQISQDDFCELMRDPAALEVLDELKVDVSYLFELQERLYQKPGRRLPIAFIMNLILDCRGDYPAKVKDIVEGHAFTRWVIVHTLERIEARLIESLSKVQNGNHDMIAASGTDSADADSMLHMLNLDPRYAKRRQLWRNSHAEDSVGTPPQRNSHTVAAPVPNDH